MYELSLFIIVIRVAGKLTGILSLIRRMGRPSFCENVMNVKMNTRNTQGKVRKQSAVDRHKRTF